MLDERGRTINSNLQNPTKLDLKNKDNWNSSNAESIANQLGFKYSEGFEAAFIGFCERYLPCEVSNFLVTVAINHFTNLGLDKV